VASRIRPWPELSKEQDPALSPRSVLRLFRKANKDELVLPDSLPDTEPFHCADQGTVELVRIRHRNWLLKPNPSPRTDGPWFRRLNLVR
jgi:hypothetical protein